MEVRSVRDSSLYSLLISSGRNKVLLVILNLSGPYILMMTVSIVFFVVGIFQGTPMRNSRQFCLQAKRECPHGVSGFEYALSRSLVCRQ